MITFLLSMIPGPWLVVLKGLPWRVIGYALVALAIAVLGWRVSVWHDSFKTMKAERARFETALQAEVRCIEGSHCLRRAREAGRRGTEAVAKARQAAQERAQREQAMRDTKAQAEAARLKAAAAVAADRESAWRRKYDVAIATDNSCRAWSASEVPCPVE